MRLLRFQSAARSWVRTQLGMSDRRERSCCARSSTGTQVPMPSCPGSCFRIRHRGRFLPVVWFPRRRRSGQRGAGSPGVYSRHSPLHPLDFDPMTTSWALDKQLRAQPCGLLPFGTHSSSSTSSMMQGGQLQDIVLGSSRRLPMRQNMVGIIICAGPSIWPEGSNLHPLAISTGIALSGGMMRRALRGIGSARSQATTPSEMYVLGQ